MTTDGLGAILLAGGRAMRMQGATKPLLDIGGRTLLATAVAAARDAGAMPVTVVGPVLDATLPVAWVREDPPFAGPAAAIVSALQSWPLDTAPEWTLLLACDLPAAGAAVRRLTTDLPLLPTESDGMCLADSASRPQWLVGIYRTRALRAAASVLPDAGRDASVRALIDDLALTVIAVDDGLIDDVDTWEDLSRARSIHEGGIVTSSRTLPPEALDAWATALRTHFDLGPDDLPVALILDLARDVASEVARPAAPFSAFVAGLVAGRAGGTPADTEAAVASIRTLAAEWTA